MSKKKQQNNMGRLKSLGLTHPFQSAFLLPKRWEDMRKPITDFVYQKSFENGGAFLQGFVAGVPVMKFKGAPKLIGSLKDGKGRIINFSKFGNTKAFEKELKAAVKFGKKVSLFGDMGQYGGKLWMKDPQLVDPFWEGKMRPVYPGKIKVITPETTRKKILGFLFETQHINKAVQWLAESLKDFGNPEELAKIAKCEGWSLRQIIGLAHMPKSPEQAQKAVDGLERLAGLGILLQARQNVPDIHPGFQIDMNLAEKSFKERIVKIPFALTVEQKKAIVDAVRDQAGILPAKRFLSGDVGTGKTVVYGMTAAIAADQGGTVGIMLPNEILVKQVGAELGSYWPDISMQIVTGETKKLDDVNIYIGTTALLFRTTDKQYDVVIVDEQQKFSREQRETLVKKGTHLLEVSATCIPRSQALVKFGFLKMSKLTKCHVDKHIDTKIRTIEDRAELFKDIKKTISDKGQVLVVYPKKVDDPTKDSNLQALEDAYPGWDKAFPGQVEMVHGDTKTKDAIMNKMKNDKTTILLSTTVVEVGVNIPNLKRVTIVHPDRHGLSGLHQLRGRVARTGGLGHCDLFLPIPRANVKEKVLERLAILEETNDGFKVAEHDLKLRGAGNLSKNSDKQSGADDSFLFGRPIRIEILENVIADLPDVLKESIPQPSSQGGDDQPERKPITGSTKHLFFYGGEFSQWYIESFVVRGIEYNCAEQAMMHQKALFFNDYEIANQIMRTAGPKEQKALGRKVKGFDDNAWKQVARKIVYENNLAKYTQNPGVLIKLLTTEGRTLVEASPFDTLWGIGLSAGDPRTLNETQWKGLNWLGQTLTVLRENILRGKLAPKAQEENQKNSEFEYLDQAANM